MLMFRLPHDDAKAWLKQQGWDERRASMGAIVLMGDGLKRVRELHERRYKQRLLQHEKLAGSGLSTGYDAPTLRFLLTVWAEVSANGDDCRRLKGREVIDEVLDAIGDEAKV